MSKNSCVIIGGGVAGLSAALRLFELGKIPIVVDADTYPRHKICGEFLSPEALPILEEWGITPSVMIHSIRFCLEGKEVNFPFPEAAGSISRYMLDAALLEKVQSRGIPVMLGQRVEKIDPIGEGYQLRLSSGEELTADQLLITTGRVIEQPLTPSRYIGIKAHFSGIQLEDRLEMHLFPGGYLGMTSVGKDTVNIACIVQKKVYDRFTDSDQFIEWLLSHKSCSKLQKQLQEATPLFDQWLVAPIPSFGVRSPFSWRQAYIIGDAAGAIPPICGDGLAISLTSGILAAEYLAKRDDIGFRRAWHARYCSQIRWGRWLNWLVLRPMFARAVFILIQFFPYLFRFFFQKTRSKF